MGSRLTQLTSSSSTTTTTAMGRLMSTLKWTIAHRLLLLLLRLLLRPVTMGYLETAQVYVPTMTIYITETAEHSGRRMTSTGAQLQALSFVAPLLMTIAATLTAEPLQGLSLASSPA